jgi:type IV pilus assembly protein PilA
MKNKKGFTLIELLAVIIILGILMIIAIPAVTSYISNSRKESYIKTAKEVIAGARNLVNSGKLNVFDTDVAYYIPISCIPTENGTESPYGKFDSAYVIATSTGDNYNYYWTSTDESQIGIKDIVAFDELEIENVESGIKKEDITTDRSVEYRKYVEIFNENCTSSEKKKSKDALENLSFGAEKGDYVTMTPTSTSFFISKDISKYTDDQTINPSNTTRWRVIKKNTDGTIEIVSVEGTESFNYGYYYQSYYNYIGFLNSMANSYQNSNYTIGARAMGYDGQTEYLDESTARVFRYHTPPEMHTTDNSYESYGWGDIGYKKDLELVSSALGDLFLEKADGTRSYDYTFIASRNMGFSKGTSVRQWYYQLRMISSGQLSALNSYVYCTNSCAYGTPGNRGRARPILTLKADLKPASGDGGKSTPYVLE